MLILILAYLPILLIALLFAPGWAGAITSIVLFISFAIAIFILVQKQTKLYREEPTSQVKLARNVLFEVMGVLLAMVLAGLLGRYIAQTGTAQISNDLTKLIAGIVIALLAGMGVGFLVKRTWGRLVKTSSES
jgi:uncharacterized protein YacL